MLRFLKEIIRPELKCKRIGCKHTHRNYTGYEYPPEWSYRAVADEISGKIYYCPRCKKQHNRTVENRSGLQGLTMPSSRWNKLKEDGVLID